MKNAATIACAVFLLLGSNVYADFGPKLIEQVRIDVRLDGKPIGNDAIGVLLVPASEGVSAPQNAAKRGPTLAQRKGLVPGKRKVGVAWVIALCVIVNFFSLPVLWFVTGHYFFTLGFAKGLQIFLCLEVAVLLAEGIAYGLVTRLSWSTAFLAALIANTTTCLLGFVF